MVSGSEEATVLLGRVKHDLFARPPFSIGYPSDTTQSQYYPANDRQLDKDEIKSVSNSLQTKGLWLENTRLRKAGTKDGEVFEVLQASIETDSAIEVTNTQSGHRVRSVRGDHSQPLSRICEHLTEARKFAANEKQKLIIEKYIQSFTTGDLEAYRESQRAWIEDPNPRVENILGFVEPYRDPAGIRAEFEGLVAIEDVGESVILRKFVESSDKFIRKLPWTRGCTENDGKGPFEKSLFTPPSFASIHGRFFAARFGFITN